MLCIPFISHTLLSLDKYGGVLGTYCGETVSEVTRPAQGGLNETVDSTRVALWGTSFGGGHVLVAGSKLNDSIAAIVSLVSSYSAIAKLKCTITRHSTS